MSTIAKWLSRALGAPGTDHALSIPSPTITYKTTVMGTDGSTPFDPDKPISFLDTAGRHMSDTSFFAALQAGQQAEPRMLPDGKQAMVLVRASVAPGAATASAANGATSAPTDDVSIGKPLPPFSLRLMDGSATDASLLSGAPALVSVFYDGCDAFIDELHALNAFRESHPEMHYLAITFNDAATSKSFVERTRFKWPVACGAGDYVKNTLAVRAYPTSYLLDAAGQIVAIHSGAIPYSIFGNSQQSTVTRHGNVTTVKEIKISESSVSYAPATANAIVHAQTHWLEQWMAQHLPETERSATL